MILRQTPWHFLVLPLLLFIPSRGLRSLAAGGVFLGMVVHLLWGADLVRYVDPIHLDP